jgi:dienelactone hydrolase
LPGPVWGEAVRIPHAAGTLAALWHAPLPGPAPLAVLSHGSSDGVDPRMTITMEGEARWLRDQGYAVLVPMRRGRGTSDGVYGETNCCDLATHAPRDCSAGLTEALEDLHTAIGFGLRQPGVQPGPVLLAGQSRGGFLSVAYAGLHPAGVSGVISFVGGWTADWCNGAFNTRRLAEAGAGAKAPQLWLHADNDRYYTADHIRVNHAAFTAAGGQAALHMLAGVPFDGHGLAAYPDRWTNLARDFLGSLPRRTLP